MHLLLFLPVISWKTKCGKMLSSLKIYPTEFSWEKFPWQKAIIHFARVLGAANTGNIDSAEKELKNWIPYMIRCSIKKMRIKPTRLLFKLKPEKHGFNSKGNKEEAVKLNVDRC